MPSEPKMRPQAFRIDKRHPLAIADEARRESFTIEPVADFVEMEAAAAAPVDPTEQAIEVAQRRGITRSAFVSWGGLFFSAVGGFVLVALGNWAVGLIDSFFARSRLLGIVGLALGGLAVLALVVLAAREIWGLLRQSRIAHLHMGFATARAADNREAARRLVAALAAMQTKRRQSARVAELTHQIIDGRDLIDIAERDLIRPLDREVSREVAQAAKRVSMVTAISPRAFVDVAFVAAQSLRLIRRIAEIYGGRPGFFGILKLTRSVGSHLAITGGMAVGDSLIQQVVGHGIAAKLSARLGEGVLNGMLTARVGLSAMAVCRPMPFVIEPAPGIRDVAPFLFKSDKNETRKI